ncbi:hypothetical protein QHH03_29515, partial [Aphanizomenon sp. 202]|nr:hypothetical protein [Aphanizomenon sp. 202]
MKRLDQRVALSSSLPGRIMMNWTAQVLSLSGRLSKETASHSRDSLTFLKLDTSLKVRAGWVWFFQDVPRLSGGLLLKKKESAEGGEEEEEEEEEREREKKKSKEEEGGK